MKKLNIVLIFLLTLLLPVLSSALTANVSNFYTNNSASFVSLSMVQDGGVNYLLAREGTTNKVWYFINTATGTSPAQRTLYNGVNYNLYQYNNYIYLTRYNGSVGASIIERYNMSYTNATQIVATGYSTSSGGDRFQTFIGKYYYKLTGSSSNYFKVYDATNGSVLRTDAYTFSFDKSYTDCIGLQIIPIGYDFDNDKLYFTCNTGDLVYIKQDFYLTNTLFNNVELNETLIDNLTTPVSIDSQAYYKFVIINQNIFFINVSNTSQILSSSYTDEYENLSCYTNPNTNTTECVNPYNFCMHPAFTGTQDSRSMCQNTTFTSQLNLINPTYDSPINMYCNEDTVYCNNGCTNELLTNSYGVQYYEANCLVDTTCTNDCYILGERIDASLSTYTLCTQNDDDACLDLSTVYCDVGEIANGGLCINLTDNISSISKINFGIIPYTGRYVLTCGSTPNCINNNILNVSYDNTKVPPVLNVETTTEDGGTGDFPFAMQIPLQQPTYYILSDCDYKSVFNTYVKSNVSVLKSSQVELITNKTIIFNGATNAKEKITFINNETTISEITINDMVGKELQHFILIVNNTNGEVTLYDTNLTGNILITLNYGAGVNIGKVVIDLWQSFYYPNQNALISIYQYGDENNQPLIKNLGYSTRKYKDILAGIPYSATITSLSGNLYLGSFVSELITSIPLPLGQLGLIRLGTSSNIITNYQYDNCVYSTDGCYLKRTYLSENILGQFFSYEDIKICKNTYETSSKGTKNNLFNLNKKEKIITSFLVAFVLLMILVIVGLLQSDSTQKSMFIFVGFFLFFGSLIVFAILEWLPFWILIIAGILSIIGAGLTVINTARGG